MPFSQRSKIVFFTLAFFSLFSLRAQDQIPLEDCPKSPNCVCTKGLNPKKKNAPLHFKGDLQASMNRMKEIVMDMEGAALTEFNDAYLHFEFTTAIGKFVDDVEFYFDDTKKVVHYRSASRVGYGDFGANKRRMKKIRKSWNI